MVNPVWPRRIDLGSAEASFPIRIGFWPGAGRLKAAPTRTKVTMPSRVYFRLSSLRRYSALIAAATESRAGGDAARFLRAVKAATGGARWDGTPPGVSATPVLDVVRVTPVLDRIGAPAAPHFPSTPHPPLFRHTLWLEDRAVVFQVGG